MELSLDAIYTPSQDVVAREIEGELIIVPIATGIGDLDEELYSLNDSGKAIWARLDGQKSLRNVVDELAMEFNASPGVIEKDVLGLMGELVRRKIVLVQ